MMDLIKRSYISKYDDETMRDLEYPISPSSAYVGEFDEVRQYLLL